MRERGWDGVRGEGGTRGCRCRGEGGVGSIKETRGCGVFGERLAALERRRMLRDSGREKGASRRELGKEGP